MLIQGRVEHGVIVVDSETPLPEGAVVSISFPPAWPIKTATTSPIDEQSALLQELHRLQNLPNENPGDDFDAIDHDKLLYGTEG